MVCFLIFIIENLFLMLFSHLFKILLGLPYSQVSQIWVIVTRSLFLSEIFHIDQKNYIIFIIQWITLKKRFRLPQTFSSPLVSSSISFSAYISIIKTSYRWILGYCCIQRFCNSSKIKMRVFLECILRKIEKQFLFSKIWLSLVLAKKKKKF